MHICNLADELELAETRTRYESPLQRSRASAGFGGAFRNRPNDGVKGFSVLGKRACNSIASLRQHAETVDDYELPPLASPTEVPKGPSPELVGAIAELKRRNRRFGCRRIAEQLSFTFGIEIDKDIVRRVLASTIVRSPPVALFRASPYRGS
jgi:hypothetical protein